MYAKVKPYMLVLVNRRADLGYSYIGEVMSFETPEKTAMVRRVPGHPGTLDEVPVIYFEQLDDAKRIKHIHYAEVSGVGRFPIDMLRYERAAPLNFTILKDDFYGLKASPVDPSFGFTGYVVATASAYRDSERPGVWCPERWRSFMWTLNRFKTLPISEAA